MTDRAQFVHDTRRIVAVNVLMCELFRCEPYQLVDLDMMELISNETFRGLARLRMVMLRERGTVPAFTYYFRRCDGTRFAAEVKSERLDDGDFRTTLFYLREIA